MQGFIATAQMLNSDNSYHTALHTCCCDISVCPCLFYPKYFVTLYPVSSGSPFFSVKNGGKHKELLVQTAD